MGIYTVVTAIVIPTVIILGFNMSIFIYTRNSVRRVENHDINAGISQQQQFRINRRDISLNFHIYRVHYRMVSCLCH